MLKEMIRFIKKNWPIILVLALSAFLRFWNLSGLIFFTLDEELEAFIVKNIVTGFHFPAIGISVAPVGIHLSPVFYYLAAIPFWLGGLDPLSWGVTASALGVITTLVLYLTTSRMFSQRVAFFASLLYSSSFLMVLYDKHFWNVTPLPLISIVAIFSLYKVAHKQLWWAIPLSFSLSLGISSHLSSLSLVILAIAIWWKVKIPVFRKQVIMALGILLSSQLPLLIFELRHNFYQTKILVGFLGGEHSGVSLQRISDNVLLLPKVFSRLIYTFGSHDFAAEHTYGLVEIAARDGRIPVVMMVVAFFLLGFFGYLIYRNRRGDALKIHGVLLLITIISLVFYGILFKGNLFEFYLALLFPSLFIILAIFFDWLWSNFRKLRLPVTLMLSVLVAANTFALLGSYHSYGFSKKIEIINWVKDNVGNYPYELHSIGYNHKYEGYRYLFEKFYKAPVKSYVDPQLSWLYQSPVATSSPKLMVVLTSKEENRQDIIEKERNLYLPLKVIESQFGDINAMIVAIPGSPK